MAVYVNLNDPLISQILIDRKIQRVEYESLPMICFHCGRYGHMKENCLHNSGNPIYSSVVTTKDTLTEKSSMAVEGMEKPKQQFGPWMVVERKAQRKSRELPKTTAENSIKNGEGSRFRSLIDLDSDNAKILAKNKGLQ